MRAIVCAALLATVVLAGCSGGDDEQGLPKSEFIAQSEAICTKHAEAQDKIFDSIPSDATTAQTAEIFLKQAIPDYKAQQKELRAVKPPEDDADEIDAIYDDADDAIATLEKDLRDDPEAALGAPESPLADVNARMKAYGLTACAQ
jgi:hypothetical protein